MKCQALIAVAIAAVLPTLAMAQVAPLGQLQDRTTVQPASCDSCDAGYCGGAGTVWGTSCFGCNVRPGLYPPCPNPCRTTLLAELICDVKGAVDTSLSHLFCCVLGRLACGCHDVCTCGAADYMDGGCGCNSCDGGVVMGGETMMQPSVPQPAPMSTQPNPFTDDPQGSGVQPIPGGSASRNMPPLTRSAVTKKTQPVRQVNHIDAPQKRPQVDAKPLRPTPASNYRLRHRSSLRTSSGSQLKQTPVRDQGAGPAIRFR